ncbi:Protein kinase superfamily protein [Zea mays]|uniref:non-specific serine/threonine protein kinase n=1 Tax=Zea mays TaxID=4577 RepID=A0A1D6KG05_MAIZE|nr:Protein kinase superfamily protein [Zea mays]
MLRCTKGYNLGQLLLQALGGWRRRQAQEGRHEWSGFRQEYQMSSLFVLVDQVNKIFSENAFDVVMHFVTVAYVGVMEARCMTKARRLGVPTPVLYDVDPVLHTLTFEHVDGLSVNDILLRFGSNGVNEERLNDIATQIGNAMANYMMEALFMVLIDFGLSFTSTIPKDRAVDLYMLERALISMHSSCGDVMEKILAAYRKASKQWCSTRNKLAQVRQRGKKRTMVE